MKFTKSTTIAASLLTLAFASNAYAVDGTIDFTGKVTDSTCVVAVTPGTGSNGVVPLGDIAATSLKAANSQGMRTPFKIALTGCSTAAGAPTKVAAYFEPTADVNLATGHLKNVAATAAATNVEIAILSGLNPTSTTAAFSKIVIGGLAPNGSPQVNIASGAATLNYFAEYVSVAGGATAGNVTGRLTYTMAYQ